jgi:hypothetical protein
MGVRVVGRRRLGLGCRCRLDGFLGWRIRLILLGSSLGRLSCLGSGLLLLLCGLVIRSRKFFFTCQRMLVMRLMPSYTQLPSLLM